MNFTGTRIRVSGQHSVCAEGGPALLRAAKCEPNPKVDELDMVTCGRFARTRADQWPLLIRNLSLRRHWQNRRFSQPRLNGCSWAFQAVICHFALRPHLRGHRLRQTCSTEQASLQLPRSIEPEPIFHGTVLGFDCLLLRNEIRAANIGFTQPFPRCRYPPKSNAEPGGNFRSAGR